MIIDHKNDHAHARLFHVCDAITGQWLAELGMRVWYADDERGIIRLYSANEQGNPYLHGTQLAWEERTMRIRIVPRTAEDLASHADVEHVVLTFQAGIEPAGSWRDRPPLL